MNVLLLVASSITLILPFARAAGAAQPAKTPAGFFRADDTTTQTIRVAAIQMRGVPGGIAPNEAKAEKLVREAARKGARYILFPELYALFPVCIWAKTVAEVRAEAQFVPGPLTDHMVALARELKVCIAFGMLEKRGDKMFNSAVFVDPGGLVGVCSKRALVTYEGLFKMADKRAGKPVPRPKEPLGPDEGALYEQGKTDGLFDWGGVKTGAWICADGTFDGLWGHLADRGAQLFCWLSASSGAPEPGQTRPDDIARRFRIPMIFANHLPNQMLHIGNSQVINGRGKILQKAVLIPDTVVVGDVQIAPAKR